MKLIISIAFLSIVIIFEYLFYLFYVLMGKYEVFSLHGHTCFFSTWSHLFKITLERNMLLGTVLSALGRITRPF